MPIWVDADACPLPIRDPLPRRPPRPGRHHPGGESGFVGCPPPFIKTQQVEKGSMWRIMSSPSRSNPAIW